MFPIFPVLKKDRTAVVYKVTDGSDVSFLPINRNDRRLNMSRFDVGGEYVYEEEDVYALKDTFLATEAFTDREKRRILVLSSDKRI